MGKVLLIEESLALSKQIKAQLGQCFYNAWSGQAEIDSAIYTQGFLVSNRFFPIEHGWLEIDGKILDPTVVLIHKNSKLDSLQYFAAEHFTKVEVCRIMAQRQKSRRKFSLPILPDQFDYKSNESYLGGILMGGREYFDACNLARNYIDRRRKARSTNQSEESL